MSVQGTFVKNRLHSPDFRRGTLVVGAYLVALCWAGFLYLLVVTSGGAASLVHPMLLGTLGLWFVWNRVTKAVPHAYRPARHRKSPERRWR